MRQLIWVILLTVCCSAWAAAQPARRDPLVFRSHTEILGDKKYIFTITEAQLDKSPVWEYNQDNPPLSVRQAIKIATKQFGILAPSEEWSFLDATLKKTDQFNKWLYEIRFRGDRLKASIITRVPQPFYQTGGDPEFTIIVLMDGSVIEPQIIDIKKSEPGQQP